MFSKKVLKKWLLVLAVLLFAVSLSSCGNKEVATNTGGETTGGGENTGGGETTGGGGEEPEESVITILIPDDPAGFNGLITDSGYEQMVGELVMLSLAEIDQDGNVFPEIAAELPTIENGGVVIGGPYEYEYEYYNEYYGEYYTYTYNYYTMEVTWKIRDDIYWADGEQLTVDDIIFTWEVVTDPETGTWSEGLDYTDSLEKIDDFTFKVYYTSLFPAYLTQFGGEDFFIYAEHYCDAEEGFFEWSCDQMPLSSGPYILEEWERGAFMTFVKNPNYFEEGKPAIDKVIVQIVPEDSVRLNMMLGGDADLHMWPSDLSYEKYLEDPNTDGVVSPTDRWVMRLIPNLAAYGETDPEEYPHPFLSQVEVRRAIRMAIDVDTILEDIFLGHGKPVWTEFFRPPYICDIPRPAFDPEAAKALLEEAGWTDTDDDGIRECHGCPNAEEGTVMTMEFAIYAEYGPELELAQQFIAENLKAIGIDTTLLTVEGVVMWDEDGGTEVEGRFELDMWDDGWPGIYPTDNHLWTFYASDAVPEYGGYNVMRWANDDFDTYLYDYLYTLDEESRTWAFCEVAKILEDELPQILLFSTLEIHGISSRLKGVLASVNDPITWNIADWTLEE